MLDKEVVGPANLELVGLYMGDMLLVEPFAISKNYMALGGQAYLPESISPPDAKASGIQKIFWWWNGGLPSTWLNGARGYEQIHWPSESSCLLSSDCGAIGHLHVLHCLFLCL